MNFHILKLPCQNLSYIDNPALPTQTTQRSTAQLHEHNTNTAFSMKLSLAFVALLSGLVVFGEVGAAAAVDCRTIRCFQGVYITCENYPGQKLDGCACVCAPTNGKRCVLHLNDGSTSDCSKHK